MENCCDNDPIVLGIGSMLDGLYDKVDELIVRQEKQLEDCKRKDQLESKLAQELKLNGSLRARVAELSGRESQAELLGEELGARLRLKPTDQQRLHNARELYAIGKELTGVRWDYSAPADVARGYIKSESRKWLRAFDVRGGGEGAGDAGAGDALWALLAGDQENLP